MKKFFSIILVMMLIFTFVGGLTTAFADGYYGSNNYYNNYFYAYQYRWSGIVICTNISIRESPSTSAKRYGQLHNGDVVTIVGENNGWYTILLSSTGLKDIPLDEGAVGFAKSSLIKSNPGWIVLTQYTNVYDDPWWTGNSNGEFVSGTPLLVKSENEYFYCVQTKGSTAGSSFIRKSDVGRYSPVEGEPGYAVVVDGPVDVWTYYGESYVLGQLKTQDIVQVVEWGPESSHIYYKLSDNQFVDAWVSSLKLQPIIN